MTGQSGHATASRTVWLDTPERYGRVSRGFHWVMAALFAWQFTGALLYVTIGDAALTRLIGGSHFTLGFTLFVLVLLRGVWGLANLHRRPAHRDGAPAPSLAVVGRWACVMLNSLFIFHHSRAAILLLNR